LLLLFFFFAFIFCMGASYRVLDLPSDSDGKIQSARWSSIQQNLADIAAGI